MRYPCPSFGSSIRHDWTQALVNCPVPGSYADFASDYLATACIVACAQHASDVLGPCAHLLSGRTIKITVLPI